MEPRRDAGIKTEEAEAGGAAMNPGPRPRASAGGAQKAPMSPAVSAPAVVPLASRLKAGTSSA